MKLVCIEDCAPDAELMEMSLREIWPEVELRFVDNEAAFRAAMSSGPDLIISDSNVPGFAGMHALELSRGLSPQIPFVFFCGDRREELKASALARGASAFVAKEDPEMLIAELRRLVRSAT